MDVRLYFLFFLLALAFSNPEQAVKANRKRIIGAIVNNSTRVGKEEAVAMEIAVEDFCNQTNQCLALEMKISQGEAFQATLAARYFINEKDVEVILGPRSWEETASVAEVVNPQSILPILSLSDSSPLWATRRWPFLFQASPSKNNQMKAVAAILESWDWRRVSVIYEDMDSASNGITPHLYDALQEVRAQISNLVALPPFADTSVLSGELQKLRRQQCRVFLIHVSLALGIRFFKIANELKMMKQGYVWITTDTMTNHVHNLDSSTFSMMQGVLGLKSYCHNEGINYQDFHERFEGKFGLKYPQEKFHEPGSFALEAYDAIWTAALATLEEEKVNPETLSRTKYNGLCGEIRFQNGRLAPVKVLQIINVFGRSYRELGFWSEGIGFSDTIGGSSIKNGTMDILGHVFWPGGPPSVPRGWDIPAETNPLRIGVPNNSMSDRFVKVVYDPSSNDYSFSGFSIDVFRETVKQLPYFLAYYFVPFDGNYSALVEQVRLKEFDAAVGDIGIISGRYKSADFTLPHTESGVVLVVPIRSHGNKAWLFLKPFTKEMWFLTASINTYNALVIWMIERNYYPELKGSALNQIGTFLWLVFASLLSLNGEGLHSNLSKMATAVWLVVVIIISQSYSASLTSLLTVPRLEATVADIGALRDRSALIGYSHKTFVRNYLLDVLHFNPNNLRNFSTLEGISEALKSGEIAGAFLEIPTAKLLIAKYCKSFTITGPMHKFGGYGYAFPKGSSLISDVNEALLKVFESGVLKELEDILTTSEKCVDTESDDNEIPSLSPSTFYVLFLLTVSTSTGALAVYVIHSYCKVDTVIKKVLKHWKKQKRIFSRKVSYYESPINAQTSGSNFAIAQ